VQRVVDFPPPGVATFSTTISPTESHIDLSNHLLQEGFGFFLIHLKSVCYSNLLLSAAENHG
jgi:hypothetical protein